MELRAIDASSGRVLGVVGVPLPPSVVSASLIRMYIPDQIDQIEPHSGGVVLEPHSYVEASTCLPQFDPPAF